MSVIKIRRGANASLPAGGLEAGEPRFSIDTGQLYIDDGANNVEITPNATNVAIAGAVMEADTTTVAMSFVIDEDNMASNLDTKVPTQQSVKAYVDASGGVAFATIAVLGTL